MREISKKFCIDSLNSVIILNHEAKSPKEETNINLSTRANLHKEPMNLHSEPHCFIPLGDSNKTDYNPQFEIGVLKFKFESFAEKVSNKLDNLAIEINSIKENKAYSIVVLESTIDELKKEKRDLCKTNAELRMENIAMKHTIADISSINKNLENEKSSLLTALQLIQNDYNQGNPREDNLGNKKTWQNTNRIANMKSREPTGHETNPSSTNETSKQSVIRDSVDCTRTVREVLNPNIQVSNRFSNLNIDESNQNDVNTTQDDTIIDHREPAAISKEVNGKSNRNIILTARRQGKPTIILVLT